MIGETLSEIQENKIEEQVRELKEHEKETSDEKETPLAKFMRAVASPLKYDEQKHVELLFEVLGRRGHDVISYCAEALISRKTFYVWLDRYPLFKAAYDMAIIISQDKWQKLPLTEPDININYWQMIMRLRYHINKPQINLGEANTTKGKMDVVWSGLKKGELTTYEANQIANLIMTEANIKLTEETGTIINTVQSRNELIAQLTELRGAVEKKEVEPKEQTDKTNGEIEE